VDRSIVNTLCCPACASDITLVPFEEDAGASGTHHVKWGVLLCARCAVWYPIYTYAPVLLTFETPLHNRFFERFESEIRKLGTYGTPAGKPKPGEASVQRSFTEEWDTVQNSDLSFLYTDEELRALNEQVWLPWLASIGRPLRTVLNVGVGLGRESLALQNVLGGAEVFAVDLNLAVIQAAERLRLQPGLHIVVASLFKLPFKKHAFDLVYSQGVIHHTFSTREALKSIAAQVAPDGYLFVWVYGLDDHLVLTGAAGSATRLLYAFEGVARPVVARMPKAMRGAFFGVLTVAAHPLVKARVNNKAAWKLVNTNHDLRDWLSPQYAHRHSYNQLFEWFEDLGFEIVDVQSPAAYRKLFNKRLWGVGLTGHLPLRNEDRRTLRTERADRSAVERDAAAVEHTLTLDHHAVM